MTLLWLLVWLAQGTPDLAFWNKWAVTLAVCVFIDATGGGVL